ncbi:MAG: NADH-quinone oxidoreductase subunit A [Verrucomicrobiales bacterium]|nr:NADH-quinone oxidoreductase subunit A [Verrucomicrobiales bacterium]
MGGTDQSYLFLLVMGVVAVLFCLTPLALARVWALLVSPAKPGDEKNAPYECGIRSVGEARVQFHSGYYLYGLVFLVFDVEALFLLPFAVAYTSLPVGAVVAMLIFLLLLVEGLVWAWRKGVLHWQ